jgi:hypothetical protein
VSSLEFTIPDCVKAEVDEELGNKQPNGQIVVGAGPVMSYYEFTHPLDDRWTDDKWQAMLNSEDVPEQPN